MSNVEFILIYYRWTSFKFHNAATVTFLPIKLNIQIRAKSLVYSLCYLSFDQLIVKLQFTPYTHACHRASAVRNNSHTLSIFLSEKLFQNKSTLTSLGEILLRTNKRQTIYKQTNCCIIEWDLVLLIIPGLGIHDSSVSDDDLWAVTISSLKHLFTGGILVIYVSLYRRFPTPPLFRLSRERRYGGGSTVL